MKQFPCNNTETHCCGSCVVWFLSAVWSVCFSCGLRGNKETSTSSKSGRKRSQQLILQQKHISSISMTFRTVRKLSFSNKKQWWCWEEFFWCIQTLADKTHRVMWPVHLKWKLFSTLYCCAMTLDFKNCAFILWMNSNANAASDANASRCYY